ncbi:hypothetical protein L484_007003 [Morus notabilis]|uniref:Uncharacterized protein n=1 Tax=Morus notabilis TaxID=981085 RepID=W9SCD7_9ROSA|nr:hypothetical protein L484_007003 [Morus notabilis]
MHVRCRAGHVLVSESSIAAASPETQPENNTLVDVSEGKCRDTWRNLFGQDSLSGGGGFTENVAVSLAGVKGGVGSMMPGWRLWWVLRGPCFEKSGRLVLVLLLCMEARCRCRGVWKIMDEEELDSGGTD